MIRKRLISIATAVMLVLSLFTLLPEGALSVQALEYGYFEYELRDGGTAAITGYNGSGKEIVIPSKIGENTVTKIGNSSFINNSDLTGVTLPSGLKTIENYAFSKCTNLKKIVIPDTVTNICYEAFAKCESLTEVTLGKNVRSISFGAFSFCGSLKSIVIPDSVQSMDQRVFSSCTSLESVTIGKGLTTISYGMFSGCTELTSIAIPDNITELCDRVFIGCTKLKNVTIPESVTKIGNHAFAMCTALTEITIPNSVTSIAPYAFKDCTALKSITVPKSVETVGFFALGYYESPDNFNEKLPDFRIYCYRDSAALRYAIDNGFQYTLLDGSLKGDVNQDGQVSLLDVVFLSRAVSGVESFKQYLIPANSFDGNDEVSRLDVVLLSRRVSKGSWE